MVTPRSGSWQTRARRRRTRPSRHRTRRAPARLRPCPRAGCAPARRRRRRPGRRLARTTRTIRAARPSVRRRRLRSTGVSTGSRFAASRDPLLQLPRPLLRPPAELLSPLGDNLVGRRGELPARLLRQLVRVPHVQTHVQLRHGDQLLSNGDTRGHTRKPHGLMHHRRAGWPARFADDDRRYDPQPVAAFEELDPVGHRAAPRNARRGFAGADGRGRVPQRQRGCASACEARRRRARAGGRRRPATVRTPARRRARVLQRDDDQPHRWLDHRRPPGVGRPTRRQGAVAVRRHLDRRPRADGGIPPGARLQHNSAFVQTGGCVDLVGTRRRRLADDPGLGRLLVAGGRRRARRDARPRHRRLRHPRAAHRARRFRLRARRHGRGATPTLPISRSSAYDRSPTRSGSGDRRWSPTAAGSISSGATTPPAPRPISRVCAPATSAGGGSSGAAVAGAGTRAGPRP